MLNKTFYGAVMVKSSFKVSTSTEGKANLFFFSKNSLGFHQGLWGFLVVMSGNYCTIV